MGKISLTYSGGLYLKSTGLASQWPELLPRNCIGGSWYENYFRGETGRMRENGHVRKQMSGNGRKK